MNVCAFVCKLFIQTSCGTKCVGPPVKYIIIINNLLANMIGV